MFAALALIAATLVAPAVAQDGEWIVRRARTSDSDTAGHYPTWSVRLSEGEQGLNVDIDEDPEAENARGHIFILKRVRVPEDESLTVDMSWATYCANDDRCGMIDLVVFTPEQVEALGTEPDTDVVFRREADVVSGVVRVRNFIGEDVPEPVALDEQPRLGLAGQLRRFAGREVYAGVGWGALHTCEEWARIRNLRFTVEEWTPTVEAFFNRIDLDHPGLEDAAAAWRAGDEDAACAAVVEYYRSRTEPTVPFAPDPDAEHTVPTAAEMALENRFTGQSKYGYIHVPEPIDWSFNPVGDPEWPWQFNRHSAWRALGEAWLATGEAEYAEKWVALLRDWVTDNPPGTPWSWRTLEAGIRIPRWLQTYFSFIDAPQFTPRDQVMMLNSLAEHAEYLMPESRFSSGSNWGLTESRGLLTMGLFMPEFEDAQRWKDTAWERILGEIDAQVYPDGAQVELTPSYHGGCTGSFLSIARMVRDAGLEVPDSYMERVERMFEFLMYLSKPDGTFPMLGDAWPGSVSGFLGTGAEFFGREDMRWLLTNGEEGRPPADVSHSFPHANYHVMRSSWLDEDARWLLFDTAPWGGGHQNPDNLQVIVYAFGATLLPDSGSYLYYGEGRAEHRRTSSHSTLTVDGDNQDTSPGHLERWYAGDVIDYADGWHDGYEGIRSRRRVLFVRPEYWLLLDTVSGQGEHTVDQHFQCAPGELSVDGEALLRSEAGPGLRIVPLRAEGALMEAVEGWVSWEYTKRERRPVLRLRREGALPVSFLTVLAPFGDEPAELTARELELADPAPSAAAVAVEHADGTDYLLLADEPRSFEVAEIDLSADCRAGLVRVDDAGEPTACALVDGSEATLGGEPLPLTR